MSISPIDTTLSYLYAMSSYMSTSSDGKKKLGELLREYNLTPSGDTQLDISRLEYAIRVQNVIDEQTSKEEQIQSLITDRPWIEIMWQLGLEPNDTIQEDYDDLIDEISYRINNAQDEKEYDKYMNMYNEIQSDFNEYSTAQQVSFSGIHDTTLIGLSQIAVMNKMAINF